MNLLDLPKEQRDAVLKKRGITLEEYKEGLVNSDFHSIGEDKISNRATKKFSAPIKVVIE